MNNHRILVVIAPTHPHFESINQNYPTRSPEEAVHSYETYDYIFDLTILKTEKKILFLKELSKTSKASIISDLTCTFQDKIFHANERVIASVSSFFFSPTNTVEFYLNDKNETTKKVIESFFIKINLKTFQSEIMEITFTTPRVVAQIINEAYFALEENLASKEDIDLSMIHGVNYPKGPIEWANKTGIAYIIYILEELYETTLDMRYRPSLALKRSLYETI